MYGSCMESNTPRFLASRRNTSRGHSFFCQGEVRTLHKEGHMKGPSQTMDPNIQQHVSMDFDMCVFLLRDCTDIHYLEKGVQIHDYIVNSGIKLNIFLENTILNLYVSCGAVRDALRTFEIMQERNIFTWTLMIAGYVNYGRPEEAFKMFGQMQHESVKADRVTFLSILKACAQVGALEQGKQIHTHIIGSGIELTFSVANSLIDMYAKCGSIEDAQLIFDRTHKPDVVSWTAMISGYIEQGKKRQAVGLFEEMVQQGVKPSDITFISILKACESVEELGQGEKIHHYIMKTEFRAFISVGNALIDMYARCGSVEDARLVFDTMQSKDVITWTAIISGYVHHGLGEEAVKFFQKMLLGNVKPNEVTLMIAVKACTGQLALQIGKEVHGEIIRNGLESYMAVASTLMDMYTKCGSLDNACDVFYRMRKRDVVIWNIIIAGHVQCEQADDAFNLFQHMECEGVRPDKVTFINILKACAGLAMLEHGKQIHADLIEHGFEADVSIGNTLVDLYAKCGNIENARGVFDRIPCQDTVSWNAMIVGYAQHGYAERAVELFKQMGQKGVKMNHITFIGVLSACSHGGLVNEGYQYFYSIHQNHGVIPSMEHYACMVDLLGRAGQLEESVNYIKKMPLEPCVVVWRTLLSACRIYGEVELAKFAAEHILKLEPWNSSASLLLSNIYAAAGKWDDREGIRRILDEGSVEEKPVGFT